MGITLPAVNMVYFTEKNLGHFNTHFFNITNKRTIIFSVCSL